METLATLPEAAMDCGYAFDFSCGGKTWTVIVRKTAKRELGDQGEKRERVDIFEEVRPVGVGWLHSRRLGVILVYVAGASSLPGGGQSSHPEWYSMEAALDEAWARHGYACERWMDWGEDPALHIKNG
jgi:hypothetical protein